MIGTDSLTIPTRFGRLGSNETIKRFQVSVIEFSLRISRLLVLVEDHSCPPRICYGVPSVEFRLLEGHWSVKLDPSFCLCITKLQVSHGAFRSGERIALSPKHDKAFSSLFTKAVNCLKTLTFVIYLNTYLTNIGHIKIVSRIYLYVSSSFGSEQLKQSKH